MEIPDFMVESMEGRGLAVPHIRCSALHTISVKNMTEPGFKCLSSECFDGWVVPLAHGDLEIVS